MSGVTVRHYDGGLASEFFRSVSHALRVVARRSGDETFASLFIAQSRYLKYAPLTYVGTGVLHVLRFQIDLPPVLLLRLFAVFKLCRRVTFFTSSEASSNFSRVSFSHFIRYRFSVVFVVICFPPPRLLRSHRGVFRKCFHCHAGSGRLSVKYCSYTWLKAANRPIRDEAGGFYHALEI